jgi:hypothetical protein
MFKGARMQKIKDGLIILGLIVAVVYGVVYGYNAIKARNAYEEALLNVMRGAQSAPAQTEENNGDSEER